jgi:thermostable 8-oxoguanine DNA glycosylase
MINPDQITNYNRTEEELEEFLMFAICVAGKNAKQTAKKLNAFLTENNDINLSPFNWVEYLVRLQGWRSKNPLAEEMFDHKLGQYTRIEKAFRGILQFKGRLDEVSVKELESVFGVGSKTARFFVLHSRPNQQVAVLDTHILKYMYEQGYDVPRSTPPKHKYGIIEEQFLQLAFENNMSVADFDLHIWKSYRK